MSGAPDETPSDQHDLSYVNRLSAYDCKISGALSSQEIFPLRNNFAGAVIARDCIVKLLKINTASKRLGAGGMLGYTPRSVGRNSSHRQHNQYSDKTIFPDFIHIHTPPGFPSL